MKAEKAVKAVIFYFASTRVRMKNFIAPFSSNLSFNF